VLELSASKAHDKGPALKFIQLTIKRHIMPTLPPKDGDIRLVEA
jgi:hypothetical protein